MTGDRLCQCWCDSYRCRDNLSEVHPTPGGDLPHDEGWKADDDAESRGVLGLLDGHRGGCQGGGDGESQGELEEDSELEGSVELVLVPLGEGSRTVMAREGPDM